MSVKLLTEHLFAFLCLKGGCKGSSESTLVKIQHCWKSHVVAKLYGLGPGREYEILGLFFSNIGTFYWVEPVL